MGRIFLTSDLHLGHNREFIYKPRGFNSIQEHDEAIVERWNSVVEDNDTVYILGDLMLNDNKHGIDFLSRLKGEKYFVRGNHDTDTRVDLYMDEQGADIAYCGDATTLKYKGYNFYLSHYPTLTGNYDKEKPLKQRVISLCGHYHTQDKFCDMDKGLIYHCELDAHNIYPVCIDTIIEDIKTFINNN